MHCHGVEKLDNDPDLCSLSQKALAGFLAQNELNLPNNDSNGQLLQHLIDEGAQSSLKLCQYVDYLLSAVNPCVPDEQTWVRPKVHPCKSWYSKVCEEGSDIDYIKFT